MPKYYQFAFDKMNDEGLVVQRNRTHDQPAELRNSIVYKFCLMALAQFTLVSMVTYLFMQQLRAEQNRSHATYLDGGLSIVMGMTGMLLGMFKYSLKLEYQSYLVKPFAQAEVKQISTEILQQEYATLERIFPVSQQILAEKYNIKSVDEFVAFFADKIHGLCEGYVLQFIHDAVSCLDVAPEKILALPSVIQKQFHEEMCARFSQLLTEDKYRRSTEDFSTLQLSLATMQKANLYHPLLVAVNTLDAILLAPISGDLLYKFLCKHFNNLGFVGLDEVDLSLGNRSQEIVEKKQIEEVDLKHSRVAGKFTLQFESTKPKHSFAYAFSKRGLLFFDSNSGLYDFPDADTFCSGVSQYINDKYPDVAMMKSTSMIFKKK